MPKEQDVVGAKVPRELLDLKVASCIECDPQVMGGMPVFTGTRIPIDIVLAASRNLSSLDELRKHYPGLSDAQIEAAQVYRQIHPKRCRPPSGGSVEKAFGRHTSSSVKRVARKRCLSD